MTLRAVLLFASVLLIVCPSTVLVASEWYVDDSVAKTGDEGAELSWNSRPEDTYTVESSSDLSAWAPEKVVESQGNKTTWRDSDTTSNKKYYRIELK